MTDTAFAIDATKGKEMNTHDKYELPPLPTWAELDNKYKDCRALTALELLILFEGYEADFHKHLRPALIEVISAAIKPYAKRIEELEADRKRRGEPVNEEELLAAREALIDMDYLWDGDQWVEVDPPSKTAKQAPEWPDFARMEASLQRLKERLVFENSRRNDLEQKLKEKRNG